MIILQNKNDEFVKEINKITFSDDIKERIINRISKQKKTNRRIYISTAAAVAIILSITIASHLITTNKNNNNYLTAENIEATESEIAISVDIDSDIDNIEINPNQKIIINIQNIQDNTASVEFTAHLTGDDKEYSFGYIIDQNYTELASDCTEEYINDKLDTKEGSEYSLYLINHSKKILTLSGNIYATTVDGEYIDLLDKVKIETSAKGANEFIIGL
jgi:hypothetical protein